MIEVLLLLMFKDKSLIKNTFDLFSFKESCVLTGHHISIALANSIVDGSFLCQFNNLGIA